MNRSLLSNNFFISFIIILVIIFLHLVTILSPIEKLTSFILNPFQNITYKIATSISLKVENTYTKKELKLNNLILQQKIDKLEQQIVNLKIFIEEHGIVSEQNKYLSAKGFEFVSAKVISKAVDSNPSLLLINQGKKSGIQKGMAVTVEDGVVIGKIIKVKDLNSIILLISDNSSKLSASISGHSEIVGLVEGKHNMSLSLNYLLKSSKVKVEDLIITSGFDEKVPAGLLIGEVEEILDDHASLFKSANINSQTNFKNIRIVSVVIN